MADIAQRPALAPRVPWRTVAIALLVVALVLATAILVAGSRQAKVPPPFGLANNGLVAYASDGDIHVLDPSTGASSALTTGPTIDTEPVFSPDGTHVAFRRAADTTAGTPEDIVVVAADGSSPTVVTTTPIEGGPKRLEWAPDSRSILATQQDDKAIWLFDATAAQPARTIATSAFAFERPYRPTDGGAILIGRDTERGREVSVLDLASGEETIIAGAGTADDLGSARWSPDGTQVVYNDSPPDNPDAQRLYIVNADGTGGHQVTSAPGTWYDIDAVWSPDGSRIAFIRYEKVGETWLRATDRDLLAGDRAGHRSRAAAPRDAGGGSQRGGWVRLVRRRVRDRVVTGRQVVDRDPRRGDLAPGRDRRRHWRLSDPPDARPAQPR